MFLICSKFNSFQGFLEQEEGDGLPILLGSGSPLDQALDLEREINHEKDREREINHEKVRESETETDREIYKDRESDTGF